MATPLFIETSALYGYYDDDDAQNERASAVVEGIESGTLPYDQLCTSRFVLAELATLTQIRLDFESAMDAVSMVRDSETYNILSVSPETFADAADAFVGDNYRGISLHDHVSGAVADENGIEHMFTFDGDFTDLGFTVIPER